MSSNLTSSAIAGSFPIHPRRVTCYLVFVTRISFFALIACASTLSFAQGLDTEAGNLLTRARANQYEGDRAADLLCIRDSYLRGEDSLRGWIEFKDARGERRLSLSGGGESFEWWSRLYGAEQWRRDDATERMRRIPPHSQKKPALASSPLSYEDLIRMPLGYFDHFTSCKRLAETDSTYELSLTLWSGVSSRYSNAEVSLGKNPVLLRRVVFSGAGKPSKSFEVLNYRLESGKYSPSDIRIQGGDGLVSLRLLMTARISVPAQDKTWAPEGSAPAIRDPRLESRDQDDSAE